MTFLVRYVDSETLDLCVQLVELINIDAEILVRSNYLIRFNL